MRSPTLEKRITLCTLTDWRCWYCGISLLNDHSKDTHDGTLDHLLPVASGGRIGYDNLVACCHTCNQQKGNRTREEYRKDLAHVRKVTIMFWGEVEAIPCYDPIFWHEERWSRRIDPPPMHPSVWKREHRGYTMNKKPSMTVSLGDAMARWLEAQAHR